MQREKRIEFHSPTGQHPVFIALVRRTNNVHCKIYPGEIGRCLEAWAAGESGSLRTLNPAYDNKSLKVNTLWVCSLYVYGSIFINIQVKWRKATIYQLNFYIFYYIFYLKKLNLNIFWLYSFPPPVLSNPLPFPIHTTLSSFLNKSTTYCRVSYSWAWSLHIVVDVPTVTLLEKTQPLSPSRHKY